jgi:2-oxoglutarate dehydrogenase E2 component (dihydrolipoamide succinyltransferase)
VKIEVPRLAESISEAVLVEWLKPDGAAVRADEPVATLETDKAAVEIAAPAAGQLHHARKPGDTVSVGDVLGEVVTNGAAAAPAATAPPPAAQPKPAASTAPAKPAPAPTPPKPALAPPAAKPAPHQESAEAQLSPAVRRLVTEHGIDPQTLRGSGPGGRVLKEDVLKHIADSSAATAPSAPAAPAARPASAPPATTPATPPAAEEERVVPMSRIRQRIAERLVRAQHTAAILTTFNEVDMTAVLDLRTRHREAFEKKHGVKLGFMSLFGRAVILGLADVPELNAEIRGTDIVYRSHVHLGIAVGTERGLVVPVVKRADALSLADMEREIARLAAKGRDGTLSLDDLSGGTFTISNGGVYGSLLSTPILNPPQSGILGMHKIEKRPVVVDDQIVIRPMMYLAVSYDHRIVDGEQAVTFLVRVKERLEDPERMLLEV